MNNITTQDKIRKVFIELVVDCRNIISMSNPETSSDLIGEATKHKIDQALTALTKIIEEEKEIEVDEIKLAEFINKKYFEYFSQYDLKFGHILATHISQWAKIKGRDR